MGVGIDMDPLLVVGREEGLGGDVGGVGFIVTGVHTQAGGNGDDGIIGKVSNRIRRTASRYLAAVDGQTPCNTNTIFSAGGDYGTAGDGEAGDAAVYFPDRGFGAIGGYFAAIDGQRGFIHTYTVFAVCVQVTAVNGNSTALFSSPDAVIQAGGVQGAHGIAGALGIDGEGGHTAVQDARALLGGILNGQLGAVAEDEMHVAGEGDAICNGHISLGHIPACGPDIGVGGDVGIRGAGLLNAVRVQVVHGRLLCGSGLFCCRNGDINIAIGCGILNSHDVLLVAAALDGVGSVTVDDRLACKCIGSVALVAVATVAAVVARVAPYITGISLS